jgi:hypothetical protein
MARYLANNHVTHPDSLSPVPGFLVSPDPGPGCLMTKNGKTFTVVKNLILGLNKRDIFYSYVSMMAFKLQ